MLWNLVQVFKENITLCKFNRISPPLKNPCMHYNLLLGVACGVYFCTHPCLIKCCSEDKDLATAEDLDD